jgi:chromosome segregation ATPase
MMNDTATTLHDAWSRLEKVCQRLWDDNSPCAVEVQAVVEEFKGEMNRVAAYTSSTEALRRELGREREDAMAALRRQYEIETASLKKRLELVENAGRTKDARADELLETLAKKEAENLEFHAQVLKMSADTDKDRAKKMESFYTDLTRKETEREEVWAKREKSLDEEHHKLQQILQAKQAELDAWEQRRIAEEDEIKRRATDVELKSQQLAQEYRKKQQEIEDLKTGLQRSITELVRQYQARVRGGDAPPAR